MNTACDKTMGWIPITIILCMFGFLKEFRPNEPFITDYLTSGGKNFTTMEVMQKVYPVGTYSYSATLVLVFLLTDLARYKPVIILCGVSGTITYTVMIWGNTIAWMQFLEITYGLFMSTEVAYYTYIYAKVNKERYLDVSACTRGAFLCGRFLAGVAAQLTTSFHILNYHQLNYLTVAGTASATCWALFLPPVEKSLYFHRADETKALNLRGYDEAKDRENTAADDVAHDGTSFPNKLTRACLFLWRDFVSAYTNAHVVKWSLWWAFATCGYLQVVSYIQPLWKTAVDTNTEIYNGAVEAAYTIIGAISVFTVGKLGFNWSIFGEGVLAVFSFLEALVLFVSAMNYNIWILYGAYVVFGVIYHTMITVASFEVAKSVQDDSYAMVFGFNTFLALVLQSLMTFVVVGGSVLELEIRPQFQVYAGYFAVLGTVFTLMAGRTIVKLIRTGHRFTLWLVKDSAVEEAHKNCDESPS